VTLLSQGATRNVLLAECFSKCRESIRPALFFLFVVKGGHLFPKLASRIPSVHCFFSLLSKGDTFSPSEHQGSQVCIVFSLCCQRTPLSARIPNGTYVAFLCCQRINGHTGCSLLHQAFQAVISWYCCLVSQLCMFA
jgi:hypothetical protein